MVEFSGDYYLSYLEPGDIIDFKGPESVPTISTGYLLTSAGDQLTTTAGDYLLWDAQTLPDFAPLSDALLGMVALEADQFRVVEINRQPDAAIQITAVQI